MNVSVFYISSTFQDVNLLISKLLNIPVCYHSVVFLLSIYTSYVSFHVFLITQPNIENMASSLKEIGSIIGFDYYKEYINNYCRTTGLLVTAIGYLQFQNNIVLHIVIIYSAFGPYIIRGNLPKFFDEKKVADTARSAILKIKDETNKEGEEFNKEIIDLLKKDLS